MLPFGDDYPVVLHQAFNSCNSQSYLMSASFRLEVQNWDYLSDGYHVRDQIYEKSIIFDEIFGLQHILRISSTKNKGKKDVNCITYFMKFFCSALDGYIRIHLMVVLICMILFQPDKRWAGICLLGVTCQECSSDRFLASYSLWFNRLLPYIQVYKFSSIMHYNSHIKYIYGQLSCCTLVLNKYKKA